MAEAEALGAGKGYAAPLDVVLDEENVVQPDLLFIRRERLHIVTEDNIQGAPYLVVEILSESSARRDMETKRRRYAEFGVAHSWVADPATRRIFRFHLEGGLSVEDPVVAPEDT
ncbi:MAG: Uma2 family endonuclease, partial [Chloroflexota bacterium]